MKNFFYVSVFLIIMFCSAASAEPEPQKLEFSDVGNGYFIYCNNPEAIDAESLVNGEKPRYIMNNENLSPGKYVLYLSHYNFIGRISDTEENLCKDMELDVELTPVSGECSYTLSNISFETIKAKAWNDGGAISLYEDEWGQLKCCASFLGKTIIQADGQVCYFPSDNKIVDITTEETKWLSEYISDYDRVHYRQPVHIQAVLEIHSGNMNVNVCAFKADDDMSLGDRSSFRTDSLKAVLRYDKAYKGIADTLPNVVTDLNYEINDENTLNGDVLPVTLYNRYEPNGLTVAQWVTHINPFADPWAKGGADDTGMIDFIYEDDSKLELYGNGVPESERDNVWYIDTSHSDSRSFEGQQGALPGDLFEPNYFINENLGFYAMNLGNYGVTYTYNLSITNSGNKDRYFTYEATTASDIIVYMNNEEFALAKGSSPESDTDVMAVVFLPAGETTTFSVNVILPVNYNGGIRNKFVIRDNAKMIDYCEMLSDYKERENIIPIRCEYLSECDELASYYSDFDGGLEAYEVAEFGDMYGVRWCAWDGAPYFYYHGWKNVCDVKVIDKDGNVYLKKFDSLPCGMSACNGTLYIMTVQNGIFKTSNGIDWASCDLHELPEYTPPEDKILVEDIDNYNISEWAYDDVKNAVALGFVPETSVPGSFTDGISRQGFCEIAVEVIKKMGTDIPDDSGQIFPDSESMAVSALWRMGIIDGYEDGYFRPEKKINREEAAKILSGVMKTYSWTEKGENGFYDNDEIQEWAREAVSVVYNYGVMIGTEENKFLPRGIYTAEQTVITLLRIYYIYYK